MDNGEIDRKKLGELVFTNRKALKKLNAITHPAIRQEIQLEIDKLSSGKRSEGCCSGCSMLIEAGWLDMVDEVWLVVADKELQINRLMQRNGLSCEQAQNRVASQLDQDIKKQYADKIIDNSWDMEYTRRQVECL